MKENNHKEIVTMILSKDWYPSSKDNLWFYVRKLVWELKSLCSLRDDQVLQFIEDWMIDKKVHYTERFLMLKKASASIFYIEKSKKEKELELSKKLEEKLEMEKSRIAREESTARDEEFISFGSDEFEI